MEIRVQEQAVQLEYAREQSPRELTSAEQNQHQLKSFHAARQHLVEKRNSMIKAMSFAGQNEQTEAHVDLVIRIQNGIEVIDKAIDEEKRGA
jgi:hypothetical protein